ncbi:DUF3169 family protein [Staphylococcus gallinarum]|uniref:DUF3169 family protein n=1 Tax=Staphylococcus gallinarum TaxID=1293 RepID=A0A3A0HCU8_STAGA|nr:DUF3169 family protein [Staphylococcus gallinarum]RIL21868.1 DUF3169 family protein [Staphylococcus gallinarum]RIL24608.1 DUF3169 family protein [Staphylococcus gallinarum]RIL27185.1 DUF3169 family protein [Staphylococcus gallinarum]RIL41613.1 DUF3169 family protein [Staphylococcus gallinarum]RIO89956.1 DUF3169 family protein [Staphylococcus gallinarum]
MKLKRYLVFVLIGAVVGGIIGFCFGMFEDRNLFEIVKFTSNQIVIIISIIASVINIVLTFLLYKVQQQALKYKSLMETDINDQQADDYEKLTSLKFMRTSTIYYIQILVSLITIFILALGNASNAYIVWAIIPFIITIIPSLMLGFFVRKYDSRMPKQGEKQYTEKVLKIMDEGERHITLVSMYKVYHINISLLIIAALFLGLFSIISGINQTIGLFMLIILFCYNAFGYLLKVKKFYK